MALSNVFLADAIAEVPRAPSMLEGIVHLSPAPTGWEDVIRKHMYR